VAAITDRLSEVRPDELGDEFEIDLTPIWPADDDRLEPIFLAGLLWFEFEESDPTPALGASEAPLAAEFGEFPELDPQRGAEAPEEPPPAPRQRASATSLFGSLGVHLLPLLVLIGWSSAPAELSSTIPVQFVVEESSAARAEAPPDRPETETISETRSNSDNNAADAAPPPPVPPPPPPPVRPPPVKTASVKPPPKPSPPPVKTASVKPPPKPSPPPEPTPRKPVAATPPAPAPPAPAPPAPAPPAPAVPARPAPATRAAASPPNPVPREGRTPGPETARGDYFDRLVALTRTHLDLLPSAFLAGRRGQTVLSIVVIADGTIGRISLKHSSGYPDVDARIEQIVAAVGRFPPLPASFGGTPSIELDFDLTFPNAIQQ
jgi:TonB family protein